jgi:hypothetical protein
MLEFTAYGQVTELPLTITVVLNHAPVVLHAISNVSVTQGSPDQVISLANTFGDDDNDVSQMVLSVVGNTNDALVTTAMAGNDLTLSFAPALAGQAEITVEALSGGKSVTTSFTVTVSPVTEPPVTGIGEEPLLTRLYPNPATTWLTLELAETRGSTIALRNALGTTVYQSQTHDQEVNINLQELPAGVYFLSVSTADHTVTQKIIH